MATKNVNAEAVQAEMERQGAYFLDEQKRKRRLIS